MWYTRVSNKIKWHTSEWTKGCDWTEHRIFWNLLLISWFCTVTSLCYGDSTLPVCNTLYALTMRRIYKDIYIPIYHLQHNEDYRVHADLCIYICSTFTEHIPYMYIHNPIKWYLNNIFKSYINVVYSCFYCWDISNDKHYV